DGVHQKPAAGSDVVLASKASVYAPADNMRLKQRYWRARLTCTVRRSSSSGTPTACGLRSPAKSIERVHVDVHINTRRCTHTQTCANKHDALHICPALCK